MNPQELQQKLWQMHEEMETIYTKSDRTSSEMIAGGKFDEHLINAINSIEQAIALLNSEYFWSKEETEINA